MTIDQTAPQGFAAETDLFGRMVRATNYLLDHWWLWLVLGGAVWLFLKVRHQHELLGKLDERCEAAFGDIDGLRAAIDPSVSAVLLEPVQGEGGVVTAPSGYLHAVRELCDERGMLMMMDEVQTGFGRTGRWFGFEHHDIQPDVVTMAKAMGNGFPVGALWARSEIAAAFRPGDHGSTYSGTALAGAVVTAVLTELQRINAPLLAEQKGEYLSGKLNALRGVQAVRGQGMLLAVELVQGRDAKVAYAELLELGVVTNAVTATALRLAPPLTVSYEEMDEAISIFAQVLS